LLVLSAGPLYLAGLPQNQQGPNVILIVSDQLQADRIHIYGNLHLTTPNIDRLTAHRSGLGG
jgi:hypothetical protein